MNRTLLSLSLISTLLVSNVSVAFSQSAPDREAVHAKIRKEAMENSQIMRTIHHFTDLYGPRLTGSPNMKAAADWAVARMLSWGFDAARLEPWNFGHAGWSNESAVGFLLSPARDNLTFEVLAWTPSTKGKLVADAVRIDLPDRPTKEQLDNHLNSIGAKVKGKIVLIGSPAAIPVNFNPTSKRLDDETLKKRFDPVNPAPAQQPQQAPQQQPKPGALTPAQVNEALDAWLIKSGAAMRINDAGREHGQIRAFNNRTFDIKKALPTVVMRNEDFGRIARLLEEKHRVSMEFDIRNRTHPEGKTDYNVIGEIKGSEFPAEVIMLGGHLDSWHAATGATDNAVGCAVMMEAARILKAIGVKPRRTIRVALWSGEEQGLLGSQAYVKKHFGSFENPQPGYERFGGYFNIDSGTGRARGMTVFGPPESATILREALAPFSDLGFMGVTTTKSRNLGGSDHTSFNQAGLPGIGVLQDPIEYGTHTWHTNLDTFERIVEEDVKRSAVIIAAAVYELAMREGKLPRLGPSEMPALPK